MRSPHVVEKPADYATGVKLMQERKYEAALAEFKGVVTKHSPVMQTRNYQIARLLMAANRAWLALEPISKAIAEKPRAKGLWQSWAEAVALGGAEADERSKSS